jgi:predicted RNase H-like nuclease (RuvC/YqgF family)
VGPKIVGAFTQDNEELKSKIDMQRTEIQELTKRVTELNDQVLNDQMSCTNRFAQREQEILVMISTLEAEAQKTNGKVTVLEQRSERPVYREEMRVGDNGEHVAMMPAPEPVIQTKTVIKSDNSALLKMIKDMKKNLKGGQ